MKNLLSRLMVFTIKALTYSYYSYLSKKEQLLTKRVVNIIAEKEFISGDIMLIALYEKGNLRSDTIALLEEAKKQNIFIIAINTLKISPDHYRNDLIDVYIEKDNFGRDFGSYKCGFNYLYNNNITKKCKRVLMINDSVFFSQKGLSKFLHDLFSTEVEVLGATENREISSHLGSFCISIDAKILNNTKFVNYWKNYKPSNVRPKVIFKGEFALSKILRSIVSNENQCKALYDLVNFENELQNNTAFFDKYHTLRRQGGYIHWGESFLHQSLERNTIGMAFFDELNYEKNEKNEKNEKKINYKSALDFLKYYDYENSEFGHQLKNSIIGMYVDDFSRGSQIHNNCVALHYMGLPIIKLDLIYRGVCDLNSIIQIKEQLTPEQQEIFMKQLTSRLNGDKFLFGINRVAFKFGII